MIVDEEQGDVFGAVDSFLDEGRKVVFFHGCNAQGSMGAGLASSVRQRWPQNFQTYRSACELDDDRLLGRVIWGQAEDEHVFIGNGITQRYYGSSSESHARVDLVESCLDEIDDSRLDRDDVVFVSVRVGCGLGGLDWQEDVRPLFESSDRRWHIYRM